MTIECAECGKEYNPDDLIDIGDKEIYFCECGYENVWI
jgi:DNA-directed RNA polymerase subunit RPC12/RpoP